MFSSSYKIGTVFGIPIKLDMSLIILFVMMFDPKRMMYSIIFTIGLLISIVLHELGHSLVAIRYKCRIREIVLMFMGGAAVMERIPRRPIQEFLMAIAGPAVSLIIGTICLYLAGDFVNSSAAGSAPAIYLGSEETVYIVHSGILLNLGALNLMLVIFNLLPAFPMDGGRVFRAALTPKFGRINATRYAANMGKLFAVIFIVVGWNPGFIGQNPNSTLWSLIIIGVFIFISAGNEYRMVVREEAMRNNPFSSIFSSFSEQEAPTEEKTEKDDDQVTISPPPYRKGEEDKTDISYDKKKNPFDDFFGRR
jgi:Zn-dependent protease